MSCDIFHTFNVKKETVPMTLLVTMNFWLQTTLILLWLYCTYLINGVLIKGDEASRASEASCSPSVSAALLRSDLRSLQ
jgi:hypothetical protein